MKLLAQVCIGLVAITLVIEFMNYTLVQFDKSPTVHPTVTQEVTK